MDSAQKYIEKVFEFQKHHADNINHQLTISEAIALMLNPSDTLPNINNNKCSDTIEVYYEN